MTGHRCLSGKECVNRTSDGPPITVKPLCEGCVKDIQSRLDELPNYLQMLTYFKGYKPVSVGQARVSGGGSEGSTPLNITALDLIDAVRAVVAEVGGYMVRDLITLPGGVQTALKVRRVSVKVAAMCGLERQWQRRRARCPDCGLATLGGWLGDDRIQCTNSECGVTFSKTEYEDYCENEARKNNGRRKNHN